MSIVDFSNSAVRLARNPLGIIALFIVLIYGFASLVVGFSEKISIEERLPIIWFMVLFPLVVIGVFSWLVSRHHKKLYAPFDFKDERHFFQVYDPDLRNLGYAMPGQSPDWAKEKRASNGSSVDEREAKSREEERNAIYEKNRGLFLVHVIEPSQKEGQLFDVFIYLLRHKSNDFRDVVDSEFFFGSYWGNRVFKGTSLGSRIGVRTSAYGSFLCMCRVRLSDNTELTLERYIDFEMGNLFQAPSS
jgi:hypothetical protein